MSRQRIRRRNVAFAALSIATAIALWWSREPRGAHPSPIDGPTTRAVDPSGEVAPAASPDVTPVREERRELAVADAPRPDESVLRVHGRVLDQAGAPVEFFGVRATRLGADDLALEQRVLAPSSHAGGEFDLLDLARGAWRIEPFAPRHLLVQPRRFWESDDRRLDFVLLHWAQVVGVVREPDGAPAAGALVSAGDLSVKTDANGRFELWAMGGERSLSATQPGFLASESIEIALDPDGPTAVVDLTLRWGVRVFGRLLDENGEGRAEVVVACGRPRDREGARTLTDERGCFSLSLGESGRLCLSASLGRRPIAEWIFSASPGDVLDVEIAPVPEAPVRVFGTVPSSAGSWTRLRAFASDARPTLTPSVEAKVRDGSFELVLPHPGRYAFELSSDSRPEQWIEVDVPPGPGFALHLPE